MIKNNILGCIKRHFIDRWGDFTGYSMVYILIVFIVSLVLMINKYERWICGNYEKVAELETRFISYDACYIRGSDGVFVRYDEKYKTIK